MDINSTKKARKELSSGKKLILSMKNEKEGEVYNRKGILKVATTLRNYTVESSELYEAEPESEIQNNEFPKLLCAEVRKSIKTLKREREGRRARSD